MAIQADTLSETIAEMRKRLSHILPDPEIRFKAELAFEINCLKKERNAVILGHNYMEPALFASVCDIVGDSLELSRRAKDVEADILIFCGVRFMAETAKIVNPGRTVLLPAKVAGCSLAESLTGEDVRKLKAQFPGVPVVTYVNTYAEVKAESDICCTSGNAAKVVNSLNSERVIFLPDEYLAKNVAAETGRTVLFPTDDGVKEFSGKQEMIVWTGRCEVHEQFTPEDVARVRAQIPDVFVLAHPECSPEVIAAADFSGSTGRMVEEAKRTGRKRLLLLTECSMGDNIAAENPDKEIVRMCSIRCPHMNEITLEDTLDSLRNLHYVIEVPEEIRVRALKAIERMLQVP